MVVLDVLTFFAFYAFCFLFEASSVFAALFLQILCFLFAGSSDSAMAAASSPIPGGGPGGPQCAGAPLTCYDPSKKYSEVSCNFVMLFASWMVTAG